MYLYNHTHTCNLTSYEELHEILICCFQKRHYFLLHYFKHFLNILRRSVLFFFFGRVMYLLTSKEFPVNIFVIPFCSISQLYYVTIQGKKLIQCFNLTFKSTGVNFFLFFFFTFFFNSILFKTISSHMWILAINQRLVGNDCSTFSHFTLQQKFADIYEWSIYICKFNLIVAYWLIYIETSPLHFVPRMLFQFLLNCIYLKCQQPNYHVLFVFIYCDRFLFLICRLYHLFQSKWLNSCKTVKNFFLVHVDKYRLSILAGKLHHHL